MSEALTCSKELNSKTEVGRERTQRTQRKTGRSRLEDGGQIVSR